MSIAATVTTSPPPRNTTPSSSNRVTLSPNAEQAITDTAEQVAYREVRPYNPAADRAGVEAVFRETYHDLYDFGDLTTIAFSVFC